MGSNERRHRRFIRQSIYIAIGFLVLVGVLLYGRSLEQQYTHLFVSFKNPNGSETKQFKLEIASDEAERNKGLMFRKTLGADEGMVFVYPKEQILSFWMKNTYISLDIVFIDKNWKVVGVVSDVPILNSEPRKIDTVSQYAIELSAGSAKANGIEVGSSVKFNGPAPKAKDK